MDEFDRALDLQDPRLLAPSFSYLTLSVLLAELRLTRPLSLTPHYFLSQGGNFESVDMTAHGAFADSPSPVFVSSPNLKNGRFVSGLGLLRRHKFRFMSVKNWPVVCVVFRAGESLCFCRAAVPKRTSRVNSTVFLIKKAGIPCDLEDFSSAFRLLLDEPEKLSSLEVEAMGDAEFHFEVQTSLSPKVWVDLGLKTLAD